MRLSPTTWPAALTARALLRVPPRVPRSTIPPVRVHEKAWDSASPAVWLKPTVWPLGLTAVALLCVPPRVPRSTGVAPTGAVAAPVEPAAQVKRIAAARGPTVRIEVTCGFFERSADCNAAHNLRRPLEPAGGARYRGIVFLAPLVSAAVLASG